MKLRKLGISLLGICVALPAIALADAPAGKAPAATTPAASKASGVVNINTASADQIALLPRLGAKVARRIVDYRKANGNFKRSEDLMQVKGIGEKQFVSLRPHVTVTGETTLAAKIKSTGSRSRGSSSSRSRSTRKSRKSH